MLHWLKHYRRTMLAGDIGAGIVVAMMMIPQGMAYALVAGLPPVSGIYASILPPIAYALFGSSMTQSVGPMAIVSLMTGAVLAPLAPDGSGLHSVLAAQLALVAGLVLLACGLLRLGFLANFFSRPVMAGFTVGCALEIAYGQLKTLLGAPLPHWHTPSALLGIVAVILLVLARSHLEPLLKQGGVPAKAAGIAAKMAPMFVVLGATALVPLLDLPARGVALTGAVPAGLPQWNLALSHQHWRVLLQPGLLIGFVVFLMSMSAAQTLAQKRNEKLVGNHELIGLGAANVAAMVSGGFPVTGSLSRSAVNFAAGAQTPLASILTALLLGCALIAPTGWLALLPLPVLAATIIVAVLGMLELDTLRMAWRYDRGDAAAWGVTCGGVLALGVEAGVVVGVLLSMGTLIWRASRPHIAVLGKIPGTEHYRNIERYPAETQPDLLMLRIDANLFFGNTEAVGERIDDEIAAHPGARHLVLVMTAVSSIDTSALLALGEWNASLKRRGVALHLAEVKGPVLDRLKQSHLPAQLAGPIFLSAAMAASRLHQGRHGDYAEHI